MSGIADTERTDSMPSTYDMGFGDSDDEGSISTIDSDDAIVRDYWFGKKYFKCLIAQGVLLQSSAGQGMADMEFQFQEVMRRFPCQEALDQSKAFEGMQEGPNLQQTEGNAAQNLMILVGSTVRTGSHKQRTPLIKAIREISLRLQLLAMRDQDRDRQSGANRSSAATATTVTSSVLDLGQYVSALKEYGDQHDFMPGWKYQSISISPPKYLARLTCGDMHFQEFGRNKKAARHQTAFAACKHFGIMM